MSSVTAFQSNAFESDAFDTFDTFDDYLSSSDNISVKITYNTAVQDSSATQEYPVLNFDLESAWLTELNSTSDSILGLTNYYPLAVTDSNSAASSTTNNIYYAVPYKENCTTNDNVIGSIVYYALAVTDSTGISELPYANIPTIDQAPLTVVATIVDPITTSIVLTNAAILAVNTQITNGLLLEFSMYPLFLGFNSNVTAPISTAIPIDSNCIVETYFSNDLTILKQLDTATTVETAVTNSITAAVLLAANVECDSAGYSSLHTNILLGSNIVAEATLYAPLLTSIYLATTCGAESNISDTIVTKINLATNVIAETQLRTNITNGPLFNSITMGSSVIVNDLTTQAILTTNASTSSTISGYLQTSFLLNADVITSSVGRAYLTTDVRLNTAATIDSTAIAPLTSDITLASIIQPIVVINDILTSQIYLDSDAHAVATVSDTLKTAIVLRSSAVINTAILPASLENTSIFNTAASVTSSITDSLTTAIPLRGLMNVATSVANYLVTATQQQILDAALTSTIVVDSHVNADHLTGFQALQTNCVVDSDMQVSFYSTMQSTMLASIIIVNHIEFSSITLDYTGRPTEHIDNLGPSNNQVPVSAVPQSRVEYTFIDPAVINLARYTTRMKIRPSKNIDVSNIALDTVSRVSISGNLNNQPMQDIVYKPRTVDSGAPVGRAFNAPYNSRVTINSK